VEPELGVEKPRGTHEELGVIKVEDLGHGLQVVVTFVEAVVGEADAVDASEALDEGNGVPLDVVVDDAIVVLKVLSF